MFFLGIIGLSFLLLLFAFHSPLISLKAGIMNLLSIGAAYGVMTLFAKGGTLGGLIGIDHEVPIAPFMPVMMFAILFGLSMDYEVFLVSRIREEYLRHGDTRRAVADGLAKTARVITAAAAIMVCVFLSFARCVGCGHLSEPTDCTTAESTNLPGAPVMIRTASPPTTSPVRTRSARPANSGIDSRWRQNAQLSTGAISAASAIPHPRPVNSLSSFDGM